MTSCKQSFPRDTYKELFKRLINPFYLPVLILISLLLILTSKENLRFNKNKFLIFFLGFGVIILSESSLGYIANNFVKNVSILILPVILTLIFYLIFIFKLKLSSKKL
jgi:lipopolysaccharide export system permease protein